MCQVFLYVCLEYVQVVKIFYSDISAEPANCHQLVTDIVFYF